MMNYKKYQQIVDISINNHKINKPNGKQTYKNSSILPKLKKTRTKSGCLTCRKRKKKCDEDIVNGKCQGCTRNFLDCCWQQSKPINQINPVAIEKCQTFNKIDKIDIKSLCNHDDDNNNNNNNNNDNDHINNVNHNIKNSNSFYDNNNLNPYPSPLPSPKLEQKFLLDNIKSMTLPRNSNKKFKHNDKMVSKFIVTSYNNNHDLVNI